MLLNLLRLAAVPLTLAGALLPGAALAQNAVTILDAFVGTQDAAIDGTVQFTMAGEKIKTATADLCFAADPFSIEVDRVRVPLSRGGSGWSGTGTSQVRSVPVKVAFAFDEKAPGSISLSGTIDWTGTIITLPIQEREIQTDDPSGPVAREPWAFNQVSAIIPSGKMPALIAILRDQGGDLDTSGLVPTCADLRAGSQTVTVIVPPERARSLRDKLASIAGVKALTLDKSGFDNSVRFSSAKVPGGFGPAGEQPVADAVLAAALQLLPGATASEPPRRDETSGRWLLSIRRIAPFLDALDLAEFDTITFLLAADPADDARAVLTFEEAAGRMATKTAGKLRMAPPATPMESFGSYVLASSAFLTALGANVAVRLGGQVYDTATESWKAP